MKRLIILLCLTFSNSTYSQQLRSVMFDPPGADNLLEFFEIIGTPNQSLDGLCFIEIDGDATNSGIIRQKIDLTGQSTGANGLFLWRSSNNILTTSTPPNTTSVFTQDFSPDLQNGTSTFLLMTCPSQNVNTDIDADNNGIPEIDITNAGSNTILDAVSFTNGGTYNQYAAFYGGTNLGLKPSTSTVGADFVFKNNGLWYAAVLGTYNGTIINVSTTSNSSWNTSGATSSFNGLGIANATSVTSVFPINLISFSGQNNNGQNLLSWATDSESAFSHFELMRSFDAKGYESIAHIEGKGTETETTSYSFIDEKPIYGNNYYKLKQVDKDGTVSYSKSISIYNSDTPDILIYPNPSNDKVFIKNVASSEISTVEIKNLSGKSLKILDNIEQEIKIDDLLDTKLIFDVRLKNGTSFTKTIIKL